MLISIAGVYILSLCMQQVRLDFGLHGLETARRTVSCVCVRCLVRVFLCALSDRLHFFCAHQTGFMLSSTRASQCKAADNKLCAQQRVSSAREHDIEHCASLCVHLTRLRQLNCLYINMSHSYARSIGDHDRRCPQTI